MPEALAIVVLVTDKRQSVHIPVFRATLHVGQTEDCPDIADICIHEHALLTCLAHSQLLLHVM